MAGKYVVGLAQSITLTTELRSAIAALSLTMEAGGAVEAFKLLLDMVVTSMRALAAATIEATVALLASPWVWVAAAVAGVGALYEAFNEKTQEQITADNDLNKAKETLANTTDELAGKSKEALQAMKAETQEALDLAEAHLKAATAAFAHAPGRSRGRKTERRHGRPRTGRRLC